MPRAAERLLEAFDRRIGAEDRLTEIFATTLAKHAEFAKEFAYLAGQKQIPPSFVVKTQADTGDDDRIDLELASPEGQILVWSEHKVDAKYGYRQMERYREALPPEAKLVTVVRDPASVPPAENGLVDEEPGDGEVSADVSDSRWDILKWQRIGELAWELGRGWGDWDWRARARKPDARACWTALEEFLWYLENRGLAMGQPLDNDAVRVLGAMPRPYATIGTLLEGAAETILAEHPEWESSRRSEQRVGQEAHVQHMYFYRLFRPIGLWSDDMDVWPEVLVADRDHWSPDQLPEPCVGAGFTIHEHHSSALAEKKNWHRALQSQEPAFSLSLFDGPLRCFATKPLSEVVDEAPDTFSGQREVLAEFALGAFKRLEALDPENF